MKKKVFEKNLIAAAEVEVIGHLEVVPGVPLLHQKMSDEG